MTPNGKFKKIPSRDNYSERARVWLFDVAGSSIFTVSTKDQLASWIEKAETWDRLVSEDPDASIILGDELNEACFELDELRTNLETVQKIVKAELNRPGLLSDLYWTHNEALENILDVLNVTNKEETS